MFSLRGVVYFILIGLLRILIQGDIGNGQEKDQFEEKKDGETEETQNVKLIPKNILAIGVTGSYSANVWYHISRSPAYDVTTYSLKENELWGWDNKHIFSQSMKILPCTIENMEDCNEELKEQKIEAVVDMETNTLEGIKKLTANLKAVEFAGMFIYVSHAGVYQVCEVTQEERENTDFKLKEDDCQRPTDKEERDKLNEKYPNQHQMLQVEEYLRREKPFPFVILRVGNVFSERDSSFKLWSYMAWLIGAKEMEQPIHYPIFLKDKKLSFTYGDEISLVINKLLNSKEKQTYEKVVNQVFNLAGKETINLQQFLGEILTVTQVSIQAPTITAKENNVYFYPTYTRAPLDISKLTKALEDWTPYSLTIGLHNCVSFYTKALFSKSKYPKTRLKMLESLANTLDLDHDQEEALFESIKKAYQLTDDELYSKEQEQQEPTIVKKNKHTEL